MAKSNRVKYSSEGERTISWSLLLFIDCQSQYLKSNSLSFPLAFCECGIWRWRSCPKCFKIWRMVNGDVGCRQSILVQGTSVSVGLVLIYPVSIFAKVQSLENLRHIPVEFMHIDIAASSCSGGYYDLRWEIRGFCGNECDDYRKTHRFSKTKYHHWTKNRGSEYVGTKALQIGRSKHKCVTWTFDVSWVAASNNGGTMALSRAGRWLWIEKHGCSIN